MQIKGNLSQKGGPNEKAIIDRADIGHGILIDCMRKQSGSFVYRQ